VGLEGWYDDPLGRHEHRWLSNGQPTALVRDSGVEGHDPPPEQVVGVVAAHVPLPPDPPVPVAVANTLPPPIIRSGVDDPFGLGPALEMTRFGVHYWLAALLPPAVLIGEVLWQGKFAITSPTVWPLIPVSLALVAFSAPAALRRRSLARDVLRRAQSRGDTIQAIPSLVSVREAFGALVVVAEWLVVVILFVR